MSERISFVGSPGIPHSAMLNPALIDQGRLAPLRVSPLRCWPGRGRGSCGGIHAAPHAVAWRIGHLSCGGGQDPVVAITRQSPTASVCPVAVKVGEIAVIDANGVPLRSVVTLADAALSRLA